MTTRTARRLRALGTLLLTSLIPMLTLPPLSASAATPVNGGTLTIGIPSDALSLNAYLTTDEISAAVESLLYTSLVQLTPGGRVMPSLATWQVLRNGTEYLFTLKPHLRFSDGAPLTPQDVVASFRYVMNPVHHSPWGSYFSSVKNVSTDGVDMVKVTLNQPYAPFLEVVATYLPIMPAAFLHKYPNFQRVEVGTGPYRLVSWTPNTDIILAKNPYFYEKGLPHLTRLVFDIIPSSASRIAALDSGQIQFALTYNPATYLEMKGLVASGKIRVISHLSPFIHKFGLNTAFSPFKNPKVRLALSYAINRSAVLSAAALGQGVVSGPISPVLKRWALPVNQLPSYRQNLLKARALLKSAGYPHGFSFSVIAPTSFPVDVSSAEVIQQQLLKIGVHMRIDKLEWGVYIHDWVTRKMDAWVGEGSEWTDPDLVLYGAFHTGGTINASNYSNPLVDRLLQQGRATAAYAARYAIYARLQKLLVTSAPIIFTFASNMYIAVSPKLSGYVPDPAQPYLPLQAAWLAR